MSMPSTYNVLMSIKMKNLYMNKHPAIPYNDIALLPPSSEAIESIAILKACIPARAALATLKQAGELLPNQDLGRNGSSLCWWLLNIQRNGPRIKL